MGKNTSISLDSHWDDVIATEVSSGRYRSASDVVRAGLRLLEDHETRVEALRQALIDGENSGPAEPFDFDEFIAEQKAKARRQRSA